MKNNEIPLLPGICYHIYNHANGFENLFFNEGNYLYFLKKYAEHIPPVADTLAHCLMPNHIHLMVRIKSESQLPESLKLSGSSGQYTRLAFACYQFRYEEGFKAQLYA